MNTLPVYKILPLGDAALTIDFGNIISRSLNDTVISLFNKLQQQPVECMTEAIPAYSSITIYYNPINVRKKTADEETVFDWMKNKVLGFLENETEVYPFKKRMITIPVCYEKEFATDMEWIVNKLQVSIDELIQLHTSRLYRVYMLGFLPGFAYMGEVAPAIELPRKLQPGNVIAGSVGIASKQTGIYPFNSPGGWQIVGRTPLNLFNKKNKELTLLQAGDRVQFISISKNEFENIKSRNS